MKEMHSINNHKLKKYIGLQQVDCDITVDFMCLRLIIIIIKYNYYNK